MGLLYLNRDSTYNTRAELFANNEQGLWLDPSQMSTLYQDSNGVTPCTAAGDPVGLILDQSRGGLSQIGADLVTNGTFAADSDWTKGANWTIGSGVATKTGGAANNLTQTIGSTAAAWYRISLDVTRSAGTLTISLGTSGTTYAITATGSYTFFILAGSGTQTLTLAGDSSFAGTVDNVVVRNVPGNHAYQTTSASRPTLARIPSSGRRNLLTRTEEFDQSPWTGGGNRTVTANAGVAPNGTQTADRVVVSASGSVYVSFFATVAVTASTQYTFSFYLNTTTSLAGNTIRIYNVSGGADIVASENCVYGGGWIRQTVTFTTPVGCTSIYVYPVSISVSNQQNNFFEIWGAQLETGSSPSNYQKVVATTDVTESGVGDLWHLVFDGSDDSLVTNSVDFTGTDEMTVIAGVRKLSDGADGTLAELSATAVSNAGTFLLLSPEFSIGSFTAYSRGSAALASNQRSGIAWNNLPAPVSAVVSMASDISSPSTALRANGTAATVAAGSQGTGNYGNYQLFIGRRNQATLPYNGHLYQLIVRGKTTTTSKLLEAERFVGRKTGVSF